MTTTVALNISERLYALRMLNAFKGDFDKLAVILEDIKQFSIEAGEWEKAERNIERKEDGGEQWTWKDEKGGDKEIALQSVTKQYLFDQIEEKSKKGELTLDDRAVLTLRKKLV